MVVLPKRDYIVKMVNTNMKPGEVFTSSLIREMILQHRSSRAYDINIRLVSNVIASMDNVEIIQQANNGKPRLYRIKEVAECTS